MKPNSPHGIYLKATALLGILILGLALYLTSRPPSQPASLSPTNTRASHNPKPGAAPKSRSDLQQPEEQKKELEKLAELPADELRARFRAAAFATYATEQERREALDHLAAALAIKVGFAETRRIITESLASGSLMEGLLHTAVLFSKDSVADIFSNLDDSLDEGQRTWIALGLQMKSHGLVDRDTVLAEVMHHVPADAQTLRSMAVFELQILSDNPEQQLLRVSELLALADSVPAASKELYIKGVLDAAITVQPEEAWNLISKLPNQKTYQQLREDSFISMLHDEPAGTLAKLDGTTNPADAALLGKGLTRWLDENPILAMQWLNERQNQLNPIQHDGVSMALATHAASNSTDGHTIQDAWTQIEKIQDPTIRKAAEGEVREREKQLVTTAASASPATTINSIISGTSGHEPYWIEEAMHTWIKQDPAEAASWHKNNWENLPPEKSQFIAAAYAKDALANGNSDLALQWAHLIHDETLKSRIISTINNPAP